jgi:hypothetical protein
MRAPLAWVWVVFLAECLVFGQQPKPESHEPAKPVASSSLTDLLDSRIKAEWQAIKNKDAKALGDLLTDDYVGVEADMMGERFKWKVLSELQQSVVADYTLSFLKVTPLCPDAALVRYEAFVRFPPKSMVPFEKILIAEIWVKRDGAWKSLHYQETKVK